MLHLLACLALLAPPGGLLCEWQPDGGTVADPCPEFAWVADDQAACRVTIASRAARLDAPDRWDSGWLESGLSVVEHGGPPLAPGPFAYQVEVRGRDGARTVLGPQTAVYQPPELPRRFPTVRGFLNFTGDADFVADHYDLTFMRETEARRPAILTFNYSLFATLVVPSGKHEQLAAWCVREGLTREGVLEAMFLHFGEDTRVRLHVGHESADQPVEERVVPGWDPANDRDGDGQVSDAEAAAPANPKATARRPAQARVPIYYWGPPRDDFVLNPAHPELQRFLATAYVPAQLEGYDGLYVDTLTATPPGPAGGRVLAEFRERGAAGWREAMLSLLAAVKRANPTVPVVGNGWLSRPFVIDGTQWENWLDIRAGAAEVRAAVEEVRSLDARGKQQWVQFNNCALDDQPTFAPRLPIAPERDQLYGLACYLLACGERTYYGYGRHP